MDHRISDNLKDLNNLNKERIFWLRISAFVCISVLVIILNWNYFIENNLIWLFASLGLITTIIWWYWTMSIIRKLIGFKRIETEIMSELIVDLKDLKHNIKKNFPPN